MTVHVRFQQTFPIRFLEWQLATIMSGFGIMASLYPTLFEASPTLRGMLAIASQPVWAALMLGVGLTGWAMLAINGGWRPSPIFRCVCALARGLIWLQFSFGIALTEIPTLGLVLFPVFTLTEIFNAYRATRDAKVSFA